MKGIGIATKFEQHFLAGMVYCIDVYNPEEQDFTQLRMTSEEEDRWIKKGTPVECVLTTNHGFGQFTKADEQDPQIQEMMKVYKRVKP